MTRSTTDPPPGKAGAWLMPGLQSVVFVALFALVILLGPRLINVDGDLGRHLTLGEYILSSRSIPTADLFSHTRAGDPLTPHEWLSEVVFASAYRLLGLDGVVLVCALLIAAAFGLVYRSAVLRSGLPLASLGLTLTAAAASSLHWLARPHLFTLFLAVVWTQELESIRREKGGAWWRLPLAMLVWVNLHGAFVFGFIIWLAYAAGWGWRAWVLRTQDAAPGVGRRLALAGGLSLAATLVNPVGLQVWVTSLGYAGNAYLVGHTAEYLSPNFHDVSAWPFLLMIVASFWLVSQARAGIGMEALLLLLGWTGLGLYSVRHVPIYAVLSVPILASAVASAISQSRLGQAWLEREVRMARLEAGLRGQVWPLVAVAAATAALAFGLRLTPAPGGNAFSPRLFPVRAVDWLTDHPRTGPGFNHFPWGGYLLLRLWPEVTVFIDGQTDFYGEALTREYEQVITLAEGWPAVLDRHAVRWAIVPADSRLAQALRSELGWAEAYTDETAVILERPQ